jgi:hypothetical protein
MKTIKALCNLKAGSVFKYDNKEYEVRFARYMLSSPEIEKKKISFIGHGILGERNVTLTECTPIRKGMRFTRHVVLFNDKTQVEIIKEILPYSK